MQKLLIINKDLSINTQAIWNGIKNPKDNEAQLKYTKELYKICIQEVNDTLKGLFLYIVKKNISTIVLCNAYEYYNANPQKRFLDRFPVPPTNDDTKLQLCQYIRLKVKYIVLDHLRTMKKQKQYQDNRARIKFIELDHLITIPRLKQYRFWFLLNRFFRLKIFSK